jgi:hypothetical protein
VGIENIRGVNAVPVVIGGVEYTMRLNIGNVAKLRDAFGTVNAAEAELTRVLYVKDEEKKTELAKFSADFISVMTKHLDCVLIDAPKMVFLQADISELEGIVSAILNMQGKYLPDAKKGTGKVGKSTDPT